MTGALLFAGPEFANGIGLNPHGRPPMCCWTTWHTSGNSQSEYFHLRAGEQFDVAAHASAVVKLYPANVGKVWKALHSPNRYHLAL